MPSSVTTPNLTSILTHLIPPTYPLPPHLLSHPLKTRQVYLPPPLDEPLHDGYIAQQPEANRISSRLEQISLKLRDAHQQGIDAVQGEGGLAPLRWIQDVESGVAYSKRDDETMLARVPLSSFEGGQGIHVLLVHEPGHQGTGAAAAPTDPANALGAHCEWKLFDVKDLAGSRNQSDCLVDEKDWFPSLEMAEREFNKSRKVRFGGAQTDGNGANGEEEAGVDDFWGGYSDDEKQKEPPRPAAPHTVPPQVAKQSTPLSLLQSKLSSLPRNSSNSHLNAADDSYWSSYAAVEDGLRVSNPSTPGYGLSRVNSRAGGGVGTGGYPGYYSGDAGYWGTGGETPVGWSPPTRDQQLPNVEKEEQVAPSSNVGGVDYAGVAQKMGLDSPPEPRQQETSAQVQEPITTASSLASIVPPPSQHNGVSRSNPSSASKRRDQLRTVLLGLRELYDGNRQEWVEVLNEVM